MHKKENIKIINYIKKRVIKLNISVFACEQVWWINSINRQKSCTWLWRQYLSSIQERHTPLVGLFPEEERQHSDTETARLQWSSPGRRRQWVRVVESNDFAQITQTRNERKKKLNKIVDVVPDVLTDTLSVFPQFGSTWCWIWTVPMVLWRFFVNNSSSSIFIFYPESVVGSTYLASCNWVGVQCCAAVKRKENLFYFIEIFS